MESRIFKYQGKSIYATHKDEWLLLKTNVDEGMEFTLSIAKNVINIDNLTEWIQSHAKKEKETEVELKQFEKLMDISLEKNMELLKKPAETKNKSL